jgi:DNA-directed RNA polymerase beta' subunit
MSLVRYRISKIQFSIASPEEILASSVLCVTEPNLYSKGIPNAGACNDLRLGTVDRRFRCGTCRLSSQQCMGHNGHIVLPWPVYHWLCFDKILKVLRCTCYWCSSSLIDPKADDVVRRFSTVRKKAKLPSAISTYCKKKKCFSCGGSQPSYDKDQLSIVTNWKGVYDDLTEEEKKAASTRFNAKVARQILQFISDDDCRFMGFDPKMTRPEWMILTHLLVPTVIIRPTTMISEGSRTKGHDDLTTLLRDICKYSNLARDKLMEEPGVLPEKEYEQLVVHIYTYFDKDGGASTSSMCLGGTGASRTTRRHITRSGPVKSLGKRLGGKRGRFRGSIVGKRSNFTSRSVITPEPNIDIWQLVVPKLVATTQTVPCPVNCLNIHEMRALVVRGDHPDGNGAHHVVRSDGTAVNLKMCKDREILARAMSTKGWVVHRHIRTGDWAVFNRQPTLHKMGMQAHELIVGTGNTFKLPVPDTTPYNADCK